MKKLEWILKMEAKTLKAKNTDHKCKCIHVLYSGKER